jgi:hypothetical protein
MLDPPERGCAGQAWFEYPATFVLFSKCSLGVQLSAQFVRPHFPSCWRTIQRPAFSQLTHRSDFGRRSGMGPGSSLPSLPGARGNVWA